MGFSYKPEVFSGGSGCAGRCVGGVAELGNGGGHVSALANLLQHIPPSGTSLGPAGSDLIVVAQVRHELLVLVHDLVVLVQVGQRVLDGEVSRGLDGLCGLVRVGHEVDEGLGGSDLVLVAVVKHAKAPDAAAQCGVAGLSRERHEQDVVAAVGRAGCAVVSVGLLGNVPAEGHLQGAVAEEGDLLAAVDGGVKVDAVLVVQGLDCLDVFGRISGVLGVGCIGKGAAVHVVDDGAGALVAALAAAVDRADVGLAGVVDGLHSLQEVVGGPGVVLGIDILHSTGSLKHGLVDGHAVRGHAERELVVSAGGILAGGLNAGADVGLLVVGPQVAQIGHQALGAPVGNQTLGSFHDDVRCAAALDSGVDLVVAVGVVEVLDGDVDVRILGIEVCQQRINGRGIAPLADGVGPQRNVSSLTGIGGGLRGSGLAGGGRGALSRRGRGRCAGSGAAAGDEHAGCHAGGQDRGNLLLHRLFSFFAFRPLWGIFVLCPS